jgi:hypothetical protein
LLEQGNRIKRCGIERRGDIPEAMQCPAIYWTNSRAGIPELCLQKLSTGCNEAAAWICVGAVTAKRAVAGTAEGISEWCDCDI